jgi:ESX secretion-associated protein EspG
VTFTARLSASAFHLVCERLCVRLPEAILVLPRGFEPEERAKDVDLALSQLRRGDWLDGRGDVNERLATALRLLDRPHRTIEVVRHVNTPSRAVLAASGRRGVRVVVTANEVTIRRIPPSGLSAQAAALVPQVPEGYGRSATLLTAALRTATEAAGEDIRALRTHLERLGVSRDIAHLVAVMNQSPTATAQFAVSGTVHGRIRRAGHVIGWWSNTTGAYLAEEHRSLTGESWTTITPATTPKLTAQINRLLDST